MYLGLNDTCGLWREKVEEELQVGGRALAAMDRGVRDIHWIRGSHREYVPGYFPKQFGGL